MVAAVLAVAAGCANGSGSADSQPERHVATDAVVSAIAGTTTTTTAPGASTSTTEDPEPQPDRSSAAGDGATAAMDAPYPPTIGAGPATTVTRAPPPPPAPDPPSPPTIPQRPLPVWTGSASEVSPELAERMTGVSWYDGCPVSIADLRHLRVDHVGFDGHRRTGELVVHSDAAAAVLEAFRRMYDARFPIERVTLIDEVGGSDDAAMAANLTTAFNCRRVTGGTGWSEHATGRAIDLNPLQNPYISSRGSVLPPGGVAYLDRTSGAVGLIVEGGPAVAAFDAVGWHWGGRWRTIKDYQHFSASGR
jgi:hypothetical protein